MPRIALCLLLVPLFAFAGSRPARAHEHTLAAFLKRRKQQESQVQKTTPPLARPVALGPEPPPKPTCLTTFEILDAETKRPMAALVRVTQVKSGAAVQLPDAIKREANWYTLEPKQTIELPRGELRIEATHGLEYELRETRRELLKAEATVRLELKRFHNMAERGWRSGNTHLHLMRLTHAEAHRYLDLVPKSDGLDLVYLSHLRRIPDERDYISNLFTSADLQRLTQGGVVFANGEEHRHNFGRGGEGYGHVMFIDIPELVRPVSIGPGIMRSGTDGRPLQLGIRKARRDGGTVIWCHNTFGFEDTPNWLAGHVHAQNIFDGGSRGTYDISFYRYLNLGMKVPFSTGTDWFIYDFNRVYTPVDGDLTSRRWRTSLEQGRSFITNGPLLTFAAGKREIGETLRIEKPRTVSISAAGIGRNNFRGLELIYNGEIVATIKSAARGGFHAAKLKHDLKLDKPGWLAVRIPIENSMNEFGKPLFAHTSPIYVEIGGKTIFRPSIAKEMIGEMTDAMATIKEKGVFANDDERSSVLDVYERGIDTLRAKTSPE
ncbi:MAG: CehA/McbA family metallohydrolase [Pirellulaceae bacterium]|nr:CehA/McbA family metallohydrolase [Pirellulaceae bacterium]